jgi:23S rRNA pseudouridine1911/1915/1917 synthase
MAVQGGRIKLKSWSVAPGADAVRLDAFVRSRLPHLSRRAVMQAIEQRLFWVDDRMGKKGEKLTAGQTVTFRGPEEWLFTRPPPGQSLEAPILYEDRYILVADKPAGMPTHGFSGKDTRTLANLLAARRPEILTVGKSRWEPGLVHRLDRETSGLVLVAKTPAAFDSLRLQFRGREIKKLYWALVWGRVAAEGVIEYPIAHDTRDRRRMRALRRVSSKVEKPKSWKALTKFRRLCAKREVSLVEVEMATGVTHQIRAHLSAIGHPIVGDLLYGAANSERFGLDRHFLHARVLEFRHPKNGRIIRVEAQLPEELQGVLSHLKMKF